MLVLFPGLILCGPSSALDGVKPFGAVFESRLVGPGPLLMLVTVCSVVFFVSRMGAEIGLSVPCVCGVVVVVGEMDSVSAMGLDELGTAVVVRGVMPVLLVWGSGLTVFPAREVELDGSFVVERAAAGSVEVEVVSGYWLV